MATKFTIEVEGFTDLSRALRAMGEQEKKELVKVHAGAADLVYRTALPRVPVRSGNLKNSLRPAATARYGAVRVGGKRSAPYAGPIHFGWPNRPNVLKEWYGGPIRPNPFLYDAFDRRREEVESLFMLGVRKAAKKAGLSAQ